MGPEPDASRAPDQSSSLDSAVEQTLSDTQAVSLQHFYIIVPARPMKISSPVWIDFTLVLAFGGVRGSDTATPDDVGARQPTSANQAYAAPSPGGGRWVKRSS